MAGTREGKSRSCGCQEAHDRNLCELLAGLWLLLASNEMKTMEKALSKPEK